MTATFTMMGQWRDDDLRRFRSPSTAGLGWSTGVHKTIEIEANETGRL